MPRPGDLLLVASTSACRLDFYEADTGLHVGEIVDLIPQPHEIDVDPGRREAYVAHAYRAGAYGENAPHAHEISVIDIDERRIVEVIDLSPWAGPHDVAVDPVHGVLYAGVESADGHNGVVIIDLDTRRVVGARKLDAPNTHWLALSDDRSKLFAAHKETPWVTALVTPELSISSEIPFPGGTEEVSASPSEPYVYVINPVMALRSDVLLNGTMGGADLTGVGSVTKIDVSDDSVVDRLEIDGRLAAIQAGPNGHVIATEWRFSDDGGGPRSGLIHLLSSDPLSIRVSIEADELPFTSRFSDDGLMAYTVNVQSGTVSVIDVQRGAIVHTIQHIATDGMAGTHGLAYVGVSDSGHSPAN